MSKIEDLIIILLLCAFIGSALGWGLTFAVDKGYKAYIQQLQYGTAVKNFKTQLPKNEKNWSQLDRDHLEYLETMEQYYKEGNNHAKK